MAQMSSSPVTDPRLTQALAAAERRLAMLERLAEMGMAIAGEITERAVDLPHRPEAGAEPARAFSSVSRAVRLTLMLAAKVETRILAMRKGELGLEAATLLDEAAESPKAKGERVRAALAVAIDREAADAEDARHLRRDLDKRLAERDDFGAFLAQPFRACVEAICLDLGLDPEPILALEEEASVPHVQAPTNDVLGPGQAPACRSAFLVGSARPSAPEIRRRE